MHQDKIFLSEQAPTEYFIIHSCMSHSNSKIVAISTVKHLSRNYASFHQPSVQEWYSLSTSGQTQSIFKRNTADFHGDGYFPAERRYFQRLTNCFESVCDINSEYRRIQVNSVINCTGKCNFYFLISHIIRQLSFEQNMSKSTKKSVP